MPKPPKSSGGLAALAALRDTLPTGPAVTAWLVARRDGVDHAWLPVTRFRQTIGGTERADLTLPKLNIELAVLEDGAITLELVRVFAGGRDVNGDRIEATSLPPSLCVDDAPIVRVGAKVAITDRSRIVIRGHEATYQLHVSPTQPSWPAKHAPPVARPARVHDLVVRGARKTIQGDLAIDGWIEIAEGALVCTGAIRCRGVILEHGATLRCTSLVTNFLHADGSGAGATLEAASVRTRVLDTVQRALHAAIDDGTIVADYHQHFGGELNPSWDTAVGDNPLRPELYVQGDDLAELDIGAIRAAGENIFVAGIAPLV